MEVATVSFTGQDMRTLYYMRDLWGGTLITVTVSAVMSQHSFCTPEPAK